MCKAVQRLGRWIFFLIISMSLLVLFICWNIVILFCLFAYLFLADLGLHCCMWAFRSWVKQGLFFVACVDLSLGWPPLLWGTGSRCSGLSSCNSQAPGHGINICGTWAPQHVESPLTRNQTHVPCIGRQILNHWTTREDQHWILLLSDLVDRIQTTSFNGWQAIFEELSLNIKSISECCSWLF